MKFLPLYLFNTARRIRSTHNPDEAAALQRFAGSLL
jgi:hypothetical protein